MLIHGKSMSKIQEALDAIRNLEFQITAEVRKGTQRDKVKIKMWRVAHAEYTVQLGALHADNRVTPLDAKDSGADKFRAQQQQAADLKRQEFADKQAAAAQIAAAQNAAAMSPPVQVPEPVSPTVNIPAPTAPTPTAPTLPKQK